MIVNRQFHNIKCDYCGALLDNETWWDDAKALRTTVLNECGWIECEGQHYCPRCWFINDNDEIETKDDKKWSDNDHKEIKN